jgi:predicted protein tyrosine phosphatase
MTKIPNLPSGVDVTHVIDHVYLGAAPAYNPQQYQPLPGVTEYLLTILNIGAVINVAGPHEPSVLPFEYLNDFNVRDADSVTASNNLLRRLDDCIRFIDRAAAHKKSVLIHCNAGYSRSAAIVLGYLVLSRRQTLRQAFDELRAKRPIYPMPRYFDKLIEIELATHGKNTMTREDYAKIPVPK